MNTNPVGGPGPSNAALRPVEQEFRQLRQGWWWFLLLGVLLVVLGTAAIVFPLFTVGMTLGAMVVLGVMLMAAGIATIIGAFWAGQWSGLLLQLLVGILYLWCGYIAADRPGRAALAVTLFLAALFIVLGLFRIVAALVVKFPQWGWSLLNGVVTFLAGVVIYRHAPLDALWVIGLLIGLEMILHGWTWIMLATAVRRIPAEPT